MKIKVKYLIAFFSLLLMFAYVEAQPTFEWASHISHFSSLEGSSITVDSDGNVYTLGYFREEADFDPSSGSFLMMPNGPADFFLQKLDSAGQFIWAKQLGGNGVDGATTVPPAGMVVGNAAWLESDIQGNIYVSGMFSSDSIDLDPNVGATYGFKSGTVDFLVSKLDSDGNLLWGHTFGGIGLDFVRETAIDADGNLYVAGRFQDTVDFNPSPTQETLLVASDLYAPFVMKLNSDGQFDWVVKPGGSDVLDLGVDNESNVYVSGYFSDTSDFNHGTGVFVVESNGQTDGYMLKLNDDGDYVSVYIFRQNSTYGPRFAIDQVGSVWLHSAVDDSIVQISLPDGEHLIQLPDDNSQVILKLSDQGDILYQGVFSGGISDVYVDSSNAVYFATGSSNNSFDVDPGPSVINVEHDHGMTVIKLSDTGDLYWFGLIDGPNTHSSTTIIGDYHKNVYLTAGFQYTADLDPSPVETFIVTSFINQQTDAYTVKWSQEDNTVEVDEREIGFAAEFYPNPVTNGLLGLRFSDPKGSAMPVCLEVTDQLGRLCQIETCEPIAGFFNRQIDVSCLSSGVYWLTLSTKNERATIKFIKR